MPQKNDPEREIRRRRLDEIERGLREGIRREVERRRRLGLPVYVAENGRVVERPERRAP
ncbi:MAG: hypothetical protein GY715_20415 [Planctomycetes bacterium]|nr:hypothetical protein [Planctomycetota bacterium]